MNAPQRKIRRALALLGMFAGAECSNPLAPFQPEVTNATDSFQLQATGVVGVTSTLTYSWSNTGTKATVNHSTTTTAGTAQLTIRDAGGTLVYDKALAASLNEATSVGTPGTWTVQLRLQGYSGTLNFRTQKLP